jgi:hypothetical protein
MQATRFGARCLTTWSPPLLEFLIRPTLEDMRQSGQWEVGREVRRPRGMPPTRDAATRNLALMTFAKSTLIPLTRDHGAWPDSRRSER